MLWCDHPQTQIDDFLKTYRVDVCIFSSLRFQPSREVRFLFGFFGIGIEGSDHHAEVCIRELHIFELCAFVLIKSKQLQTNKVGILSIGNKEEECI